MSTYIQDQVKHPSAQIPSFAPAIKGLVQRKCAVDECHKKKMLTEQRFSTDNAEPSTVPPIVREVLRSPGQPLDPATRASMEPLLGHDFGKVKVHTDDRAAKSVRAFNTRAYATGNHVAFGIGQYSPTTSEGKELLFHELIHIAQNQGDNKLINFWSRNEHHKLTKEIVDFYRSNQYSPSIMRDPLFGGEQFYRIIDSSFNMDVTTKRILWTGPRFVMKKVPIISPLGTKGEGPEHGEDDNYSKPGKKIGEVNDDARNQNVKLQEEYVKKSLDFYKKEKGQIRRYVNKKIQVTSNVEAMFKALGDACHVAQDRGAHWEGTKGMGHDDERARRGAWNPDSPTDNQKGYANARKNTYDVFKMWVWETTMRIGYDWY